MIREPMLFGGGAETCLLLLTGAQEEEMAAQVWQSLRGQAGLPPFFLAAVEAEDWNAAFSPWRAEPVFGNEGFAGRGGETLQALLSLLPHLREAQGARRFLLGGYSLAGLFALWAVRRTDAFAGAAGVSPSVWFEGWDAFRRAHPARAGAVYLSLGRKEPKTRNARMAAVGDRIREEYDLLRATPGVERCTLEWNEGNHFTDPAGRTAKGFAWLLQA